MSFWLKTLCSNSAACSLSFHLVLAARVDRFRVSFSLSDRSMILVVLQLPQDCIAPLQAGFLLLAIRRGNNSDTFACFVTAFESGFEEVLGCFSLIGLLAR